MPSTLRPINAVLGMTELLLDTPLNPSSAATPKWLAALPSVEDRAGSSREDHAPQQPEKRRTSR